MESAIENAKCNYKAQIVDNVDNFCCNNMVKVYLGVDTTAVYVIMKKL